MEIALDSVATVYEIRNERMREMLFETAAFPLLTISTQLEENFFGSIVVGTVAGVEIPILVSLHGKEKSYTAPVLLARNTTGELLVVASSSIIVNAADFDLVEGVGLLRAAANLKSVSTAVAVSFQLSFKPID